MNNISEILLNSFFPGYKITNFSKDDASKHLEISLEPIEPPVCPHCNSHNVVVHQYRKRKVIDEKLLGYFVTLVISYRTVTCNYCSQNGTEDIPFVAQRHRVTKRAQQAVIDVLERAGSIKDISEHTGIHWDTCKTIHKISAGYLLLSRNSKLSDKQKISLNDILNHYKDLYAANELKELLPEVFYANSKEDSERLWDEWVDIALHSEVEEIIRFATNQNKNYRDGITNSGIYNIRTSVLEGINNKIKVLKRLAYGFRDLDYFFLRIRNAFRGITA